MEISIGQWFFPNYIIPKGHSYDEELRKIAYDGIAEHKLAKTKELVERVEYELKIIKNKEYAQYFLVVADLLHYARKNNILTTTRGSAGGSMVSYLTYITTVNPIEYDLPFERFLNPERPSAPDIDIDIADNRRDEIIEYTKSKYGLDKVAQIGTFGTMAARGAVRDVTRALGFPYSLGDSIAKLIPVGAQGFPMTLDRALKEEPELKKMYDSEVDVRTIITMAKKITAFVRLQIPAGQANPAPPIGPALGQQGVNIMEFCKQFNAVTKDQSGLIIPVVISVYQDKSFSFITKSPPAAVLLKKAVGIAKGSGTPNKDKVGSVTPDQIKEIVKIKIKDLNSKNESAMMRIIEGTARSMGIEVKT